MDQIKTSFTGSRPDAGLTLIEMLVALAIMALVTSFVAMSVSSMRGAGSLEPATIRLGADLRAARSQALLRGATIELVTTASGYEIEALSVERQWDPGLQVRWQVSDTRPGRVDRFVFSPTRLSQTGLVVTLQEGDRTRSVQVFAITGRVDVQ